MPSAYIGAESRDWRVQGMDGQAGVTLFRLPTLVPRPELQPPRSLGLGLVFLGVFTFGTFLYAAVISKLLPPSGVASLDFVREDWYYNALIPLTLPTLVVAVYLHWLSMKVFKHA